MNSGYLPAFSRFHETSIVFGWPLSGNKDLVRFQEELESNYRSFQGKKYNQKTKTDWTRVFLSVYDISMIFLRIFPRTTFKFLSFFYWAGLQEFWVHSNTVLSAPAYCKVHSRPDRVLGHEKFWMIHGTWTMTAYIGYVNNIFAKLSRAFRLLSSFVWTTVLCNVILRYARLLR